MIGRAGRSCNFVSCSTIGTARGEGDIRDSNAESSVLCLGVERGQVARFHSLQEEQQSSLACADQFGGGTTVLLEGRAEQEGRP